MGNTGEQATCSAYSSCNDQRKNSSEATPDTTLIEEALGTLVTYEVNTNKSGRYFVASRYCYQPDGVSWGQEYECRFFNGTYWSAGVLIRADYPDKPQSVGASLRPVVVLKSGLTATQIEDKTDTTQNKTFKQWKVN